ncbi:ATP-binding cassette domain-containing protein [Brevibacillus brevis]|uniref:UvrABC system protein A n=1 Tax=Brevibacillus brevis TaxID=1393 RepID=A0A2Z4MIW2_BREBE|nr:ATP-binding cassette domain-containing protein [Brevibacillus brevis]AWX56420.1 ATP-binding cassette domain-containing protein [Brevibacillus brevis]
MQIEVYNAKLHNLKNITTTIPKHQFIVVTGVSGSGKSSFIFDTLHHEGQRIYLEALGIAHDVLHYDSFDMIQGLSPTIAVQQRTVSNLNPRSVVGSVTRILNLLAIIYAQEGQRAGEVADPQKPSEYVPGIFMFNSPHGSCPTCGGRGYVSEVNIEKILPPANETIERWHQFAYQFPQPKKEEKEYVSKRLENFTKHYGLSPDTLFIELSREAKETFLHYRPKRTQSKGHLIFYGVSVVIEEKLKKINTQQIADLQTTRPCTRCAGFRLGKQALSITINNKHIGQLCQMNVGELTTFFQHYLATRPHTPFITHLINEILRKLNCLETVGLSYLNLYREIPTLSGGETQRLHIMSHLSAKVDSIIYIFDEPTAGLHEKEKEKIIESFHRLKQQGNTVIVVEHDESVIKHADYIMDFGPLAGQLGGSIVYQGNYSDFLDSTNSITAQYLREKKHPRKEYTSRVDTPASTLSIKNARTNNLKNIDVSIPLHAIVGVSGLSGSGKSSLVIDTLIPKLQASLKAKATKQKTVIEDEAEHETDFVHTHADAKLEGAENIDGCIVVTQKLARRHENSCVATFLGVWDHIRHIFSTQEEAIALQFTRSSFSFNSTGSCTVCNGHGYIKRWLGQLVFSDQCPACRGKRFKPEVMKVRYKERTISDILEMSISEAHEFFGDHAKISKMLGTIEELGMGYILIGQSLTTLSGGEAQRLKLARELGKGSKGSYLYILDEPTVGLSYYDTEKLLVILGKLVENGHSVLLIEHDPYVLAYCDYLIELGPGAGNKGGEVIAEGSPEEIKQLTCSMIGPFLE